VENGVACDLAEGIYLECALSELGVEGADGGFYRRVALMVVLGCGVAVMEQVTHGSRCDGGGGWCCQR
jgi:hypothetical protein